MPQPPSPSMGIIWPTDNDDANQWAPIMDTAIRVVIDGHNHSAGSGAQVSIGSLKFDTDISFVDAGGGKHAITDLKAIDFFPSPPSAMVGLGGAFFVSDGTGGTVANELYYRTTLGANVQVSSGATLNVGAFAGTIGGDYTGVAALESFVDATDAYLFQQQVGGGVRQFAKMQCADLQLFEFKTVAGGPPVPTQAVTLKSPAALAAGYALTFPGALPTTGAASPLLVDSTGQISCSATQTLQIPPGISSTTGPWNYAKGSAAELFPLPLTNGDRITALRFRILDTPGETFAIALQSVVDGVATTIGTSASSTGGGTKQTIALSGLAADVSSGTNYQARVFATAGAGVGTLFWIEVDWVRP